MLLALISTTIFFSGCSKKEKVETAEPVKVLTIDQIEQRKGIYYEVGQATPFTGLVQDLYASGTKRFESNYKDGKRHGVETRWDANGKKTREWNYKDGKIHGVVTGWDKDGSKKSEVNYKDGMIHGMETQWHANGTKMSEVNYENWKKQGVETRWLANGTKMFEVSYKDGKKVDVEDPVPSTLSATQADAVTAIKELGGSIKFGDSPGEMIQVQLQGKQFTDAVWPHLKNLTDLTALTLNDTQVTDLGLRQLKELTKLTSLTLWSNDPITDAGLAHLKDLKKLRKLSIYSPRGTLSDAGLEHLKGLTKLKELSLRGTQFTDTGLENLKGLSSLATLRLENIITARGMVHQKLTCHGLTHLKDLTDLTDLTLERVKFTDENLVRLKELKSLTSLTLYGTNITDAGLEHVKGLTSLKNFKVVYWPTHPRRNKEGQVLLTPPITRREAIKLKEALPDCEVDIVEAPGLLWGSGGSIFRKRPPPGQGTPRVRRVPTPPSRTKATPVRHPRRAKRSPLPGRAPGKTLMKRGSGLQFQKSRALATGSASAKITTHTVVDESTIVNTGAALVSAANFGEVAVTVNSLLHGSETGAGTNLTFNSRFEGALRANPLPAPLDTLFRGIAGAPSISLDISGLEIGTEYLFQAYWEDNAGQTMNVTMEGDTLSGLADQPTGVVISYTFTAGDDTLNTTFTRVDSSDKTWLSGYSLQKVTPTNPELAAITPPDDALEALNTANLVSTFDMMVQPGTGNISIYKSDDTLVEVIDVNDTTAPGTLTFSGTNVTIDPTAPLEDGVGYYVLIDNTAITNVLSRPFAGIANKTGWNFTAKSLDGLSGELGVLDLSANNGINPATGKLWKAGDTYRFLFITSQATTAESGDIATYNKFVQGVANDSKLNLGGATWKVVGSTAAVDARTNTTTDPAVNGTGEAFFLLDGSTVLATNYTDLWDGLAATPNIDEHAQPSARTRAFTGSFADGTAKAGDLELGGTDTNAGTGINDNLGTIWLNSFNDPRTDLRPLFAMSDPLKIVGVSTSENHDTSAEQVAP